MHVSLDDVIDGKVKVPAFRAVYINELLEAHDDIASDRDRNFRTLVKNFKTIDDSDFEVPEEMNKLLRPYQVHGYKWLQTLAHANFGGILADDMGLGKTIQILALLDAWKQENYSTSSLVICPASVVFNWKNEAARFSPSLSVKTLTGTPEERRELVREIENGQGADLYVGSYEQVRRDIAMFKDVTFTAVILDEAQNTNMGQLKMFLTRMGCDAKFIVTGDASQIDLPRREDSGLLRGVKLVEGIKGVSVIRFLSDDIVRHPLVTKIVKAFDEAE